LTGYIPNFLLGIAIKSIKPIDNSASFVRTKIKIIIKIHYYYWLCCHTSLQTCVLKLLQEQQLFLIVASEDLSLSAWWNSCKAWEKVVKIIERTLVCSFVKILNKWLVFYLTDWLKVNFNLRNYASFLWPFCCDCMYAGDLFAQEGDTVGMF